MCLPAFIYLDKPFKKEGFLNCFVFFNNYFFTQKKHDYQANIYLKKEIILFQQINTIISTTSKTLFILNLFVNIISLPFFFAFFLFLIFCDILIN